MRELELNLTRGTWNKNARFSVWRALVGSCRRRRRGVRRHELKTAGNTLGRNQVLLVPCVPVGG